jgi:hypothetical protein
VAQGNSPSANDNGASGGGKERPQKEGVAAHSRKVKGIQPVNPCRSRGLQAELFNLH